MQPTSRKRSRSRSPPPWHRHSKNARQDRDASDSRRGERGYNRRGPESFAQEQSRINEAKEDAQMREWVSKEDEFVLKQSKKKALIRVREGRAKPIDWLAVILSIVDPSRELLEEESEDAGIDIMDPTRVIEGLNVQELKDLEKDIDQYSTLTTGRENHTYWKSISIVCRDRRDRLQPSSHSRRGVSAVSADVDRLLAPKSLEQLNVLEGQVKRKLQSHEPIDEDHWEQLLSNIGVYKAKAQLKTTYGSIIESRLKELHDQLVREAKEARNALDDSGSQEQEDSTTSGPDLSSKQEEVVLDNIAKEREKIKRLGYIPSKLGASEVPARPSGNPPQNNTAHISAARPTDSSNEEYSQITKALYDREAAKGVQEDEEIFTAEEEVPTASKASWEGRYRPRKPRYFNRVQMGYEWNKYNQTHYDHDNPPPKVVQGYKFNIFYPDLIDKTKAPTYRIVRENGRKRGQTFAPAGQEDTCLIRFISGPPYEDIAFRIVDKEWDYSAKHERGFRSSFDKGILQLHFQFKKVYYRK